MEASKCAMEGTLSVDVDLQVSKDDARGITVLSLPISLLARIVVPVLTDSPCTPGSGGQFFYGKDDARSVTVLSLPVSMLARIDVTALADPPCGLWIRRSVLLW